ncbi:HMGL-like [seawater metagenome]|uniref:2-isopropylmalate synthase n=1 Tax=seawater metagenome TaxID=1561972 RepID=A0A5E8CIC6_9ZZZZ
MVKRIKILDTTLRDGEQTPNISFNLEEKLKIMRKLEELGVDICELGFPSASQNEYDIIFHLASLPTKMELAVLVRMKKEDILTASNCLRPAKKKRIYLFYPCSDIHLKEKVNKTREEALNIIKENIKIASMYFDTIQFSAEDATRTDIDFLIEAYQVAIDNGATIIGIADTLGFTLPDEYGNLIKKLKRELKYNKETVTFSVHCHNDLGLATANSLAGVLNGADQIEGTINGIGERAGNASLEEISVIIKTKLPEDYKTNLNHELIYSTSKLVENITQIKIPPNKAITGDNAFKHASGIHQAGIIKNPKLYHFFDPKMIGKDKIEIIIGKLSGSKGLEYKLKEMNLDTQKININKLLNELKKKSKISDEIILEEYNKFEC